jgi:Uma2 family endonuclease
MGLCTFDCEVSDAGPVPRTPRYASSFLPILALTPDVSAVCQPNPANDSFQDKPAVIFEVLSENTGRIDFGEKREAYLTIPSLTVYAMVEQDTAAVVVYRRSAKGFEREVYQGLKAVLPLAEIGIELSLGDIYENVEFLTEHQVKTEGDHAT